MDRFLNLDLNFLDFFENSSNRKISCVLNLDWNFLVVDVMDGMGDFDYLRFVDVFNFRNFYYFFNIQRNKLFNFQKYLSGDFLGDSFFN